MDSNEADKPSVNLDTIRKTAISRRGGVRVRGGRLPPIRIRDVVSTSSTKKVIAPKIPQRRIAIKKEIPEPSEVATTFSKDDRKDFRKPLSRGRSQRVYIQTEGSFLEQGPAIRLKKETMEPHYERIPRSSSRMKLEMGTKIDASQIHLILGECDETDDYLDCEDYMRPVQFPYIKMESKPNIKEEILDNQAFELKIKEEILDEEDIKSKIKKEPEDDTVQTKGNEIQSDVKTIKQEIPESKMCTLMEAVKLSQEEDVFVLFQLPTCFPFKRYDESSNPLTKEDKSSTEQGEKVEKAQDEATGTSLKDMPEGFLGKLQILKSGRMRLALGSVDIAIENGINEGSTTEVISIPLANEGEGDFIVLGKIYQKMIMHPILTDSETEIKNETTSE